MKQLLFSTTKAVSALIIAAVFGITNACRPINDPTNTTEEVLPNLITLMLVSNQDTVRASWVSTTDIKGTASRIDTLVLVAGRIYVGKITAVNNTKSSTIDLTQEYKREAEKHQFFYTVTGDAQNRITFTITDKDSNNLPLGLEFTVLTTSGGAARGMLNVVLAHYDDVKKTGTNRSPETDIDITFPLVIR